MRLLRRLRFGIFSRVYLFGLSLLVCMAAAAVALINLIVNPIQQAEEMRFSAWIVDLVQAAPSIERRRELLRSLRDDLDVEIALYDANGELLLGGVTGAGGPLAPALLARAERERQFFSEAPNALVVGDFADGKLSNVALVRYRSERRVDLGVSVLLGVLGVLALLAWPLARSLSMPIRRLNATMTRFGHGDMDARAKLARRDELGELARAYDEMADRIVALLRAEKLLIAGVAHELRTPLQRIRIAIELASEESGQAGDPSQQRFETMLEDLRDLEHVITNVLTVARLESVRAGASHELLRHREYVGAELLVRECALKFEMRHPERQLELSLPAALPNVCVERQLMAMAISNLLENANEYSPSAASIDLRASAHGDCVLIEVVDRGIGIASEHIAEIFKPFFRTDAARSRSSGGAGLGLAIVKGVVEAHGGEVSVRSVQGEETCFTLSLPCSSSPDASDP